MSKASILWLPQRAVGGLSDEKLLDDAG